MKTTSTLLVSLALASIAACAPDVRSPEDATGSAAAIESQTGPAFQFTFDQTARNATNRLSTPTVIGTPTFAPGLEGSALRLAPDAPAATVTIEQQHFQTGPSNDFSVQFWVRSDAPSDHRFVLLSQKAFPDNSLASQKNPGWVFYTSGGTWAWSMGSGNRRITYERDNGHRMPLNDGRWHQLAMTYSSLRSEVRLYYDGVNWVTYHVSDSNGFDFSNQIPLTVGVSERPKPRPEPLPEIVAGAQGLQTLVDAFDALGLTPLAPDELIHLVVDPRRLATEKLERLGADSLAIRARMDAADWEPIAAAERALSANPYTVHQNLNFTRTAPLTRVYLLKNGQIEIQPKGAAFYAERERLDAPDFDMDNLTMWERTLGHEEVAAAYHQHFEPSPAPKLESVNSLTAAVWNIWHGGKHWNLKEHGWDSRIRIAHMLREAGTDVVMMQETYSSGDFIAAELGFYFATTVDWDYLNQGANISVMSRWPITEVHVDEASPFNNVGARVTVSETQDLQVMSNWYGMGQFPSVFNFHSTRFEASDDIPVLFGGDFNAIPHTDGGDSPASVALLEAGFIDAYRSLYPDVANHPGPTHRNGERIDQLYYRGAGLTNTSTVIVSDYPGGFPSDHALILSTFGLDYSTGRTKR